MASKEKSNKNGTSSAKNNARRKPKPNRSPKPSKYNEWSFYWNPSPLSEDDVQKSNSPNEMTVKIEGGFHFG